MPALQICDKPATHFAALAKPDMRLTYRVLEIDVACIVANIASWSMRAPRWRRCPYVRRGTAGRARSRRRGRFSNMIGWTRRPLGRTRRRRFSREGGTMVSPLVASRPGRRPTGQERRAGLKPRAGRAGDGGSGRWTPRGHRSGGSFTSASRGMSWSIGSSRAKSSGYRRRRRSRFCAISPSVTCSAARATRALALSLGCASAQGSEEAPPEPLDAAILFAPVASLVPTALKAVRPGGIVVCAGIHMSEIPAFPFELR